MTNREQKIEEAKHLKTLGKSNAEIAAELGVKESTVSLWFDPEKFEAQRAYMRRYHSALHIKEALRLSLRLHERLDGHVPCSASLEQVSQSYDHHCHACRLHENFTTGALCLYYDKITGDFRAWLCRSCMSRQPWQRPRKLSEKDKIELAPIMRTQFGMDDRSIAASLRIPLKTARRYANPRFAKELALAETRRAYQREYYRRRKEQRAAVQG